MCSPGCCQNKLVSVRRENCTQASSRLEKNRETMKSFIGSLVYCFSVLLLDLCESYDLNNPSYILAQSYAQRRINALPHRTLNPAGKCFEFAMLVITDVDLVIVCYLYFNAFVLFRTAIMISLFSVMHYNGNYKYLLTMHDIYNRELHGIAFQEKCTML